MKNYFITGLVVLLPVTITIFLFIFLFNFFTAPFAGFVKEFLTANILFSSLPEAMLQLISQILTLGIFFIFTVLLGIFGRWLFVNYLIDLSEKVLQKIPFIRSLYNMSKDVISTLFRSQSDSFKQVVLVPYPNKDTLSIGLITKNNLEGLGSTDDQSFCFVFIPCTLNPSSGFMMMFNKNEIIYLDTKVEQAFKYIISCGVIDISLNLAESKGDNA